jgi:hypothetical protein
VLWGGRSVRGVCTRVATAPATNTTKFPLEWTSLMILSLVNAKIHVPPLGHLERRKRLQ